VAGPLITIKMLGDRDGWRCHLCRKAVRPTLRHPHPGAPTFDHLIPISDGGDDRPENLRLAHFRCNSARGNRGIVQLMLIG
jgi:5-methylcytosine-specific restriction endonuclease McrA